MSDAASPISNAWQTWYRFSRNPGAVIGLAIVVIWVAVAAAAVVAVAF